MPSGFSMVAVSSTSHSPLLRGSASTAMLGSMYQSSLLAAVFRNDTSVSNGPIAPCTPNSPNSSWRTGSRDQTMRWRPAAASGSVATMSGGSMSRDWMASNRERKGGGWGEGGAG